MLIDHVDTSLLSSNPPHWASSPSHGAVAGADGLQSAHYRGGPDPGGPEETLNKQTEEDGEQTVRKTVCRPELTERWIPPDLLGIYYRDLLGIFDGFLWKFVCSLSKLPMDESNVCMLMLESVDCLV